MLLLCALGSFGAGAAAGCRCRVLVLYALGNLGGAAAGCRYLAATLCLCSVLLVLPQAFLLSGFYADVFGTYLHFHYKMAWLAHMVLQNAFQKNRLANVMNTPK